MISILYKEYSFKILEKSEATLSSGTITASDVQGYYVFDNDTSIETQMQNMTANRAYMGFIDAYSKSNANTKCPGSGYYFTLCWSRSDYNRIIAFHVNSQNMFTKNYQSSSGWTDWAAIMRTESQTAVGNSTKPIYATANGVASACSDMMPLAGSTFTGQSYAYTNTNYSTYQLRNIAFTTSTPSSLTNGNVCMVYS